MVHTVITVNIPSVKIADGKIHSPFFDSYSDNVRSRDFVYFLKEFKKRSRAPNRRRQSMLSMRPPQTVGHDLRDTFGWHVQSFLLRYRLNFLSFTC